MAREEQVRQKRKKKGGWEGGREAVSLSRRRLQMMMMIPKNGSVEKFEEHWKILRNLGDRRYTSLIYYIIILHNPKLSATKI